MAKKSGIDGNAGGEILIGDLSRIIETRKSMINAQANGGVILMCWEIGGRINDDILKNDRAEYGKQIVARAAARLQEKYGTTFAERNLRRMMQFSTQFDRNQIVSLITTKLSWSHIVELLPLGTDAKSYYIEQVNKNYLTCSKLRDMISRKAFERREIANAQLAEKSLVPFNIFKDPYLLDTLGLKDNFLEADLENAILQELGKFILEFGHGFTFIERQKRVTIGDKDFHIDLLFYHRDWQRLVVIELKRDEFKAAYKGQMELYLKWLDKNERKDGENAPIGIILCPRADKNVVELLELDKSGIAVAEFWTKLPPKKEFETKINQLLAEAKERVERRKQIGKPTTKKQIDFFYDTNDEEDHAD